MCGMNATVELSQQDSAALHGFEELSQGRRIISGICASRTKHIKSQAPEVYKQKAHTNSCSGLACET